MIAESGLSWSTQSMAPGWHQEEQAPSRPASLQQSPVLSSRWAVRRAGQIVPLPYVIVAMPPAGSGTPSPLDSKYVSAKENQRSRKDVTRQDCEAKTC